MGHFILKQQQIIPVSIQKAWDYFSNPNNLAEITPPELSLCIKTRSDGTIYNGMIIEYDVRPIFNISMKWLTEIKHVTPPYFFVDEQRSGPYTLWYHQHFFKETQNGTEINDVVQYRLPYYSLLFAPLVQRRLERIFGYRKDFLQRKFGGSASSSGPDFQKGR